MKGQEGRLIAVKEVVFPTQGPNALTPDDKEKWREKSLKEVKALQKLNHENVIHYYGSNVSPDNSKISIYLELMSTSVSDELKKNGPFDSTKTLGYAHQIWQGLKHMHSKGVIHKDLKGTKIAIFCSFLLICLFYRCQPLTGCQKRKAEDY